MYLLVALRPPVFDSQLVRDIREQLHGGVWVISHLLYFIVPAALIGVIFRKNAGKLTIILIAMTIAAVLLGFGAASKIDFGKASTRVDDARRQLLHVKHR